MNRKFHLLTACALISIVAAAQTESPKASVSTETRVTNYFQSGYEFSVFWNTSDHFAFGAQIAGQEISGSAKKFVFQSSDYNALAIRITWLAAFKTRFFFFIPIMKDFIAKSASAVRNFEFEAATKFIAI